MVAVLPSRQPSAAMTREQVVADVQDVMVNGLLGVTNQDTPADVFYHNGTVFTGSAATGGTWNRTHIDAAPGLAAVAYLGGYDSTHWSVQRATNVMDYAVSVQELDGEFVPPGAEGTPNQDFILADMVEAILLLDGKVAGAKIDAWTASVVAAAQWLWTNEQNWYTNGNIELLSTCAFEMVYRLTGDATWADRRDAQYLWTVAPNPINPPGAAGSGLIIDVVPLAADGSDGAGYLTEYLSGVSSPGYDPSYANLQLSFATRWYQFSGDPRALRLMNLLHNKLMPRVDQATWLLDATGGTRLNTTEVWWSPATPALVWGGLRTDIPASRPADVWAGINNHFRRFRTNPGEPTFRALATFLPGWLRAAGVLPTGV